MESLNTAPLGRLRFKHLDLFRHAVEQRTLGRAAELTHMTQPAATKLIHELEHVMGAALLSRGRHGVRLTAEGEVLYRHVGVLLADFTRMSEEVDLARRGGWGHLRLGVLPSLAPGLLAHAIGAMVEAYPSVKFTVREGSTTELLEALERNELDLAFARVLEQSQASRLQMKGVYVEPFAIVVGKDHPLLRVPRARRWQALSEARWVLPESGTPLRATIDQLFVTHKQLRPAACVECYVLERVADLVADASMVGVLPHSFALRGHHADRLTLLVEGIYFGSTSLVARSSVQPDPVVATFVTKVQNAVAHLRLSSEPPQLSESSMRGQLNSRRRRL